MENDEIKKSLYIQMKTIDQSKWFQGENIKQDPGQEFIINWIKNNAEEWRNKYNKCICKNCECWKECGEKLKTDCQNFSNEEKGV